MADVNRRKLLKTGFCILGSAALDPIAFTKNVLAWGAIENVAETHQFIVKSAMNILRQQPIMKHVRFPSGDDIAANDWVIKVPYERGPGPDITGASNFSDHYYNPDIFEGHGPIAVKGNFMELITELATGKDCSKSAAWAAHFISDMNVPYHVNGMPKFDALKALNSGNIILNERITGPHHLYFGNSTIKYLKNKVSLGTDGFDLPMGWGYKNNFEKALRYLSENHISDEDSQIDWFDPWYYNGYSIASVGPTVITGSHALWEYLTHLYYNPQVGNRTWADIVRKQGYFDKQWVNHQVDLFSTSWEPQGNAAKLYAEKVARRTKDNIPKLWENSHLGVCYSVQSVLTLFRASMTAIRLQIRHYSMGNNLYGLECDIVNTESGEAVENVYLTLLQKMENGSWEYISNTSGEKIHISPGQTGQRVFYGIKIRPRTTSEFKVEVSGFFKGIPDLGYTKQFISISNNQFQPDPVQSVEPIKPKKSTKPSYLGYWNVTLTMTSSKTAHKRYDLKVGRKFERNWRVSKVNNHVEAVQTQFGKFEAPYVMGPNISFEGTRTSNASYNKEKIKIKIQITKNKLEGKLIIIGESKTSGDWVYTREYHYSGSKK